MRMIESARRAIRALELSELYDLDDWLHRRIDAGEKQSKERVKQIRNVVEGSEKTHGEWTFRLEYVKCGKERCRKDAEKGHGPYWYGYRTVNGKTQSKYFGKKLPDLKRSNS